MPSMRYENLIDSYHDEIYRYIWRLLNTSAQVDGAVAADDLTQDVFLRAYRAFGRLRAGSNYRAWLYKIATNRVNTALRRERRIASQSVAWSDELHQLPSQPMDAPQERAIVSESLDAVRNEIAALPPKQQAAVVMRHVQGLEYGAIAQAIDCSEQSARANVYQGLQRLRRVLVEQADREER